MSRAARRKGVHDLQLSVNARLRPFDTTVQCIRISKSLQIAIFLGYPRGSSVCETDETGVDRQCGFCVSLHFEALLFL